MKPINQQFYYSSKVFIIFTTLFSLFQALTVTEVTLTSNFYSPSLGSMEGGTLIYVKGSGFSLILSENIINIGPYPCNLNNVTNSNLLSCFTTLASILTQISGLPINITVGSSSFFCNQPNCLFTYVQSLTPYIEQIVPRTLYAGQTLNVYGSHQITNIGDGTTSPSDIISLMIGDKNCSLNGIIQNSTGITGSSRWPIKCKSSASQIAGEYNFLQHVKPGYARVSGRSLQTSYFTGVNYTQRIVSQITSLSAHQGGIQGHIIKLKGSGFSPNISDYYCQISGQICQVTNIEINLQQVTVQIPKKSPSNVNYGRLQKQPMDTSIQINGFLGGNGALYQRYDKQGLWKTSEQWLTYLRSGPTIRLIEETIIKQLSSPEIYGQNYVQYVRGYFHAPVSGQYNFSLLGDDFSQMVLSTYRNNTNEVNLQPFLKHQNPSGHRYNPFVRIFNRSNVEISLQNGYYYFQLVSINGDGVGHFKVIVDMPKTNLYTANPTWHMQKITIKPSMIDAEVIKVTVYAASGNFDLYYYDVSVLKKMNVPVGASATVFQSLLVSLPNINTYEPVVTLITLDSVGNPTTNPSLICGYQYTITIARYRPVTSLPSTNGTALVAGVVPKSIAITRPTSHSPRIGGFYSILINGTPISYNNSTNLAYNLNNAALEIGFRSFLRSNDISIARAYNTQAQNSIQLIIEYIGYFGTPPTLTINTALLTGGKTGSTMITTIQTLRSYSDRQLYHPLPYDFLYVPSFTPALKLFVKSLPAFCLDCSYIFNQQATPIISSFTRTGNQISLMLTDPASLGFTLDDIQVSFLGVSCVNQTGTSSDFNCFLPINSDNSVMLPAGTGLPKVHITQIGYAEMNSNYTNQTVPMKVFTTLPSQTSIFGGQQITLTGQGFPISSAEGLRIEVCGNPVNLISSVSNQVIKFIVPLEISTCTGTNNVISYGGQSSSFIFFYNPCIIPSDPLKCAALYSATGVYKQNFVRVWSNASQWPNSVLPSAGQSVVVPYEWNLLLDIDPPILNYLEVNGILNFDRSRNNTLQAYIIWIKQGSIKVGSENLPFNYQANFILHGNRDDFKIVVDREASGNKAMIVTGSLELYGQQIQTTWTKLTRTAQAGVNQIYVDQIYGWKIGDKIVIAPSYSGKKQFQELFITDIEGRKITLSTPLSFEHYGSQSYTLKNDIGQLDTRSAVGLLNRNIKISSFNTNNNNDDWGCKLLIYGGAESEWGNGYAKLKGVQIIGCGQYNATSAAIRLQNMRRDFNYLTYVQQSSIHHCKGMCAFIKKVQNVKISNSVFFKGNNLLVYVDEVFSGYNFTNNLLVGALKTGIKINKDRAEDVAAYQQYVPISPNSIVNVKDNLVQGSEGEGFVFPATSCALINFYPFINNTAGSCQISFMYNRIDNMDCLAVKGSIGYASQIGLMANMQGTHTRVQYSNLFFADCRLAISLRFAHEGDDNILILRDSYFVSISRQDCSQCYNQDKLKYCQNSTAIKLLVTTSKGESFPLKRPALLHDSIYSEQTYDSKCYLFNVVFENYADETTNIPFCSNMKVFRRNTEALDATASHYLINTTCINCSQASLIQFDENQLHLMRPDFLACEDLMCKYSSNYFIFDFDGSFFGQKSQLLSTHADIDKGDNICQSNTSVNSCWHRSDNLAILQYESIANDFISRPVWPSYLIQQSTNLKQTIDAWRIHFDHYSQNRIARFWSVIKLNNSYSLSFGTQPPSDMRFQIQKRSYPEGNSSDRVAIRIKYPLPSSIEVLIKDSSESDIVVSPLVILNNNTVNLIQQIRRCGDNTFNSQSGMIQFLLTGQCQVRVRLANFLELRIQITSTEANNRINSISQRLEQKIVLSTNIDADRIKVLSTQLKDGRLSLQFVIQTQGVGLEQAKNTPLNPSIQYFILQNLQRQLENSFGDNSIDMQGFEYSYKIDLYVFHVDGSLYVPSVLDTSHQLLISLLIINFIIGIFIVFCYIIDKRSRSLIHDFSKISKKNGVFLAVIKRNQRLSMKKLRRAKNRECEKASLARMTRSDQTFIGSKRQCETFG